MAFGLFLGGAVAGQLRGSCTFGCTCAAAGQLQASGFEPQHESRQVRARARASTRTSVWRRRFVLGEANSGRSGDRVRASWSPSARQPHAAAAPDIDVLVCELQTSAPTDAGAGADAAPESELACPKCQGSLQARSALSGAPWRRRTLGEFYCASCDCLYPSLKDGITDFASNEKQKIPSETLFESPLVARVYETPVWQLRGRPPFELEYAFARRALQPARNGLVLDVSCGPARMSRRLLQSGQFARVYGVDASEAMLREAAGKRDAAAIDGLPLLRADVERLPFRDGAVDGAYAGAAIHCWPDVPGAMAELARVLRPGGVLVASTFTVLADTPLVTSLVDLAEDAARSALAALQQDVLPRLGGTGLPALPLLANALHALAPEHAAEADDAAAPLPLRRALVSAEKRQFTFGRRDRSGAPLFGCYEVSELEALCAGAGLVDFEAETFAGYTVFCARKPPAADPAADPAPAPAAPAP